jgi:hypothetical protein
MIWQLHSCAWNARQVGRRHARLLSRHPDQRKREVDPEGMERDAALAEARRAAQEPLGEVPDIGQGAVVEIADEAGTVVITIPSSEAIAGGIEGLFP